jgi:hypothetical protein
MTTHKFLLNYRKKKGMNLIKTFHGLLWVPYFITVFTKVCSFCFLFYTKGKINRSKSFEFLTAVLANIQVFWGVRPFRLVNIYRRFEGLYCLLSQDQAVQKVTVRNVRYYKYLAVETASRHTSLDSS